MRLYLSSYRIGNHPERLIALIGKKHPRIAIIANAGDIYTQAEQAERIAQDKKMFKDLGIEAERVDLRKYFAGKGDLEKDLKPFDAVWVRGGNSYILRRAMRQSGFDRIILRLLNEDKLVYAGYSAGVAVLQKSLKGSDAVDDPDEVPAGYTKGTIWEGLGLLPYNVAVHYKSDHPESPMVDKEIKWLKKNKIPYKTLKDGQVIIIKGDKEEFLK